MTIRLYTYRKSIRNTSGLLYEWLVEAKFQPNKRTVTQRWPVPVHRELVIDQLVPGFKCLAMCTGSHQDNTLRRVRQSIKWNSWPLQITPLMVIPIFDLVLSYGKLTNHSDPKWSARLNRVTLSLSIPTNEWTFHQQLRPQYLPVRNHSCERRSEKAAFCNTLGCSPTDLALFSGIV